MEVINKEQSLLNINRYYNYLKEYERKNISNATESEDLKMVNVDKC